MPEDAHASHIMIPAPFGTRKKPHVAMVRGMTSGAFLERYYAGAQSMAKELGIKLTEYDSENNQNTMAQHVLHAIQADVDGIIIHHASSDVVMPALDKALKKGIKVVAFDSVIPHPDVPEIEQDDLLIGNLLAKQIMADYNGNADIIYVNENTYAPLSKRDRSWKDFKNFYTGLRENAHVGKVTPNAAEETQQLLQGLLQGLPNTDVLLTMWDEFAKGAVRAVTKAGLEHKVKVYSVDITDEDIAMMREPDSPWEATVTTDARAIGRLTVRAVAGLLAGESIEKHLWIEPQLITRGFLLANNVLSMDDLVLALPILGESPEAWFGWMPLVLARNNATLPTMTTHSKQLLDELSESLSDLEQRNTELQMAAEIARDATGATTLNELLNNAVDIIQERFDFYIVSIFLLNDAKDTLVHKAGSGEVGTKLCKDNFSLSTNSKGIVNRAYTANRPLIVINVEHEKDYLPHPILRETASEAALPLHLGGEVIGVLDVQSTNSTTFDQHRVRVLQTLADQISLALEKTHLLEHTRVSLETRLDTVISSAPLVLFTIDKKGIFTMVKGKGLEAMGFEDDVFVGQSAHELFGGSPTIVSDINRALSGEAFASHLEMANLIFDVRWNPLRDSYGKISNVVIVATDITERVRAEKNLESVNMHLEQLVEERTEELFQKTRELEETNYQLRELDELKSSFLSTVSHDLRTPLTSILGFAKLINRDFERVFYPNYTPGNRLEKAGKRIASNLNIIVNEGERLTRLINDFLDLTKIEAGRMNWRTCSIEMDELIKRVSGVFHVQAMHTKNVSFKSVTSDFLPQIQGDPDRMEQLLINLINNAFKFTPKGSVTVSAFMPTHDCLEIRVIDTGVGVPAQDLDKIFDKFHQASRGDTIKGHSRGSGLGLAICRQIVEHYNGKIWAESEVNKGTTVIVQLPVEPEAGKD